MKKQTIPALLLVVLVLAGCLSVPAEAVDGGYWKQNIRGKSLLILGDSYCAGYGLERREDAWPYQMADTWNLAYYDHAISGSTFASGPNSSAPMVERVREITREPLDIIIVQGASNDWSHNIPVGETDSRDPETAMGALNVILDTLEDTHPEATLVCFTPWISNGTKNDLGLETSDYRDAMIALCQARDILCYDASDDQANGIRMASEEFRAEYCLTPTDRWHMNPKGQAMFAPVFSAWLQNTLYGPVDVADQFADLIPASEELRSAAGTLAERGIMRGTSETLFSPARMATRETLAVTLYRMAGSPSVEPIPFSDVHSNQDAISWAVKYDILLEDGAVHPKRSLTRQELAAALYRYYTVIAEKEVTTLHGVGGYPDRDALADNAASAFGWALQQGMFSAEDGYLRPGALVSRGQLAVALAKLLEITA